MESVRANSIKIIKGTPSSAPVRPTLENEGNIHQYPLAYIYRKFGSTVITQANITNMVGTDSTPFVTGIIQTISLDELLGQWQDQLDQFVANEEADFSDWFNNLQTQLSGDVAGNLQLQIDKEEVKRILLSGFADGSKAFNEDGTVITSTADDGRTLVKTFTNNFLTMTTVLKSAEGGEIARMVKQFSSDGTLIGITTTYA